MPITANGVKMVAGRSYGKYYSIKYKSSQDMSSVQPDGTHTPAKRGGEAVASQERKNSKTSNMLIHSDSKGIPISCRDPNIWEP